MIGALAERVVEVDISTKTHPETYMIADDAFAQRFCSSQKWCLDGSTGYAVAKVGNRKIEFHRLIMQGDGSRDVDHINGDKLDNRIANLRWVSRGTNAQNTGSKPGSTSKYKGVHLRPSGKYYATIRINERNVHLGSFTDPKEAAKAYNAAALKAHGPYAWVNRFEGEE